MNCEEHSIVSWGCCKVGPHGILLLWQVDFSFLPNSWGLLLDDTISWIFWSKKVLLAFQTVDLKAFQLWRSPVSWYMLIHSVHCSFHHSLKCLMMRLIIKCIDHVTLKAIVRVVKHLCMSSWLLRSDMSMLLILFIISFIKASSSLLFFFIA